MKRNKEKNYTLEERKRIHEYLKQGMDITTIASNLNRNYQGVCMHIKKRGGYMFYDAEQKSNFIGRKDDTKEKKINRRFEVIYKQLKFLKEIINAPEEQ